MPAITAVETAERRRIFVLSVAEGKTAVQAAKRAGYANPTTEGYRLMHSPGICEAIREAVDRRAVRAMPQAIGTLIELQSEKYPPAVRLAAAKTVIEQDRALRKPLELNDLHGKPLDKMTETELLAVAKRMQEQRAELEVNAPSNTPDDGQVIDM